jgi:ribonuclease P protein component
LGQRGRRYSSRAFVLLVASQEPSARARLGVTASRRVGNAVVRNRVKRRIREWFRRDGQVLLRGRDLVVIARPAAAALDGTAVSDELAHVARSIA